MIIQNSKFWPASPFDMGTMGAAAVPAPMSMQPLRGKFSDGKRRVCDGVNWTAGWGGGVR